MIIWQALFGYSLLISIPVGCVAFVLRGMFSRKVEPDQREMLTSEFERTP